MATVLPGSPPGFDRGDMAGTVRAVCGYLRTLHDNVGFQLGHLQKTVEGQQKVIDDLKARVQAQEGR